MAAVDSKGNIWVGSLSPGITRFDPETGLFTKFNDPSADLVNIAIKAYILIKRIRYG
jgi:sugar lactone lactonase YvrE